jgi:hypothetical protein
LHTLRFGRHPRVALSTPRRSRGCALDFSARRSDGRKRTHFDRARSASDSSVGPSVQDYGLSGAQVRRDCVSTAANSAGRPLRAVDVRNRDLCGLAAAVGSDERSLWRL